MARLKFSRLSNFFQFFLPLLIFFDNAQGLNPSESGFRLERYTYKQHTKTLMFDDQLSESYALRLAAGKEYTAECAKKMQIPMENGWKSIQTHPKIFCLKGCILSKEKRYTDDLRVNPPAFKQTLMQDIKSAKLRAAANKAVEECEKFTNDNIFRSVCDLTKALEKCLNEKTNGVTFDLAAYIKGPVGKDAGKEAVSSGVF